MNNIFNNGYGIVIMVYLVGNKMFTNHMHFCLALIYLLVVVCVIGRFTVTDS